MGNNNHYYITELTLPYYLSEAVSEALEVFFDSIVFEAILPDNQRADMVENHEPWLMRAYGQEKPDLAEAHQIIQNIARQENIELQLQGPYKKANEDWLLRSQSEFPAIMADPFYIYGDHIEEEVPKGMIGLQMDATRAFGTGQHETTKSCLMLMGRLATKNPSIHHILDMGAGSGILSFGAAKLWDSKILSVDIDAQAKNVIKQYASKNNVQDQIHISIGHGYDADQVSQNASYDLILCNIFANPLIEMAPLLKQHIKIGGYAIISGFLEHDAQAVLQAHLDQGLQLVDRIDDDGWVALILQA